MLFILLLYVIGDCAEASNRFRFRPSAAPYVPTNQKLRANAATFQPSQSTEPRGVSHPDSFGRRDSSTDYSSQYYGNHNPQPFEEYTTQHSQQFQRDPSQSHNQRWWEQRAGNYQQRQSWEQQYCDYPSKKQHDKTPLYDIKISKALSYNLRHQHRLRSDGFATVSSVLAKLREHRPSITLDDIKACVEHNEKGRFEMKEINGEMFIRAVQGHSKGSGVNAEELMTLIQSGDIAEGVIFHGTQRWKGKSISSTGLNGGHREQIHFIDINHLHLGRENPTLFVVLDVEKYLKAGGKLFRAGNGVINSPGLEGGIIPPSFFSLRTLTQESQNTGLSLAQQLQHEFQWWSR